jgi:hypothetical protein
MLLDHGPHETTTIEPPGVKGLDAGVIDEARRRQRRQRGLGWLVAIAAVLIAVAFVGRGSKPQLPPIERSSSLTPLTGPRLTGRTGVHLIVAGGGNPGLVHLVNLDSAHASVVQGLGIPAHPGFDWSASVTPSAGGALTTVAHWICKRCALPQIEYVVDYNSAVRRIGAPPPGPTLSRRGHGECTLRTPGQARAVVVPCGQPCTGASCVHLFSYNTSAGVVIGWQDSEILVNPRSGRVLARASQIVTLTKSLILTMSSPDPSTDRQQLVLRDPDTGRSRTLRWPVARIGYPVGDVVPEPHGPLVAIEFVSAIYHAAEAEDIWILNTRTASFTHLPGFPALEFIKQSNVAWTGDDRLVVASQYRNRSVVGVWRPGQTIMPVRPIPNLAGYENFVALARP